MRFQLLDILPNIENPVTGRLVSPPTGSNRR